MLVGDVKLVQAVARGGVIARDEGQENLAVKDLFRDDLAPALAGLDALVIPDAMTVCR